MSNYKSSHCVRMVFPLVMLDVAAQGGTNLDMHCNLSSSQS